ncbi:inactive rhomboid protein 1 isoform X2 [Ischnura elegans]|uniref:inactive rhomboid protein 1 isoform X2 n=1 Tax=Ischnura elegans TaxID=197161 RepID=UPI001ED877BE|nr:inactive rhomboid protein 1 isoform X2 [Ischnura elegans]
MCEVQGGRREKRQYAAERAESGRSGAQSASPAPSAAAAAVTGTIHWRAVGHSSSQPLAQHQSSSAGGLSSAGGPSGGSSQPLPPPSPLPTAGAAGGGGGGREGQQPPPPPSASPSAPSPAPSEPSPVAPREASASSGAAAAAAAAAASAAATASPSPSPPVSAASAPDALQRSLSAPMRSLQQQQLQQHHQVAEMREQDSPTQGLSRSVSMTEAVKNYIRKSTASFFGVDESSEDEQAARWMERRKRLALRRYGAFREDSAAPAQQQQPQPQPPVQPAPHHHQHPQAPLPHPYLAQNYRHLLQQHQQQQIQSAQSQLAQTLSRQESAYAAQEGRAVRSVSGPRPDVLPSSDAPDGSGVGGGGAEADHFASGEPRWAEPPVRRKESVARMTIGGIAYIVSALTSHRPRQTSRSRQLSRSYAPASLHLSHSTAADSGGPDAEEFVSIGDDEVFFDRPVSAHTAHSADFTDGGGAGGSAGVGHPSSEAGPSGGTGVTSTFASDSTNRDQMDRTRGDLYTRERGASWRRGTPERMPSEAHVLGAAPSASQSAAEGAGTAATGTESYAEVGMSRITSFVLDRALDNSDRRQYGMGVVGRFFRRSVRRSVVEDRKVREQLDDMEDHRPFFTYWATTVQVLVMIISLVCYGFGPIGFDLHQRSSLVLVTSLSLQQVDYMEPSNFWIGPRAADLIHLGAKFAPCMRKDYKVMKEIEKAREKERETACCIRNDDSGCVQSSQADCSVRGLRPTTISTWKKWSAGDSGPGGRISGSVCGLDPKFCEAPPSVAPYEWPDDITKWPICRKTSSIPQKFKYKDKAAEHMVCEVIGHPCCIGIHGECRITTREYCDFVRGHFHEEASLCSQVSCLDNVCGMIPFYNPEVPDQFYRLWTSLFLHAGLLHLKITLVVQYFLMRDLEKLAGPLRIGIIYLGSGVGGNLASAIFTPYRAEVGPAGAQFGLLACLVVEVLHAWPLLRHPGRALMRLLLATATLLLLGLLPWIDNYAHLFGFVFGFLLSYALLPFVSFGGGGSGMPFDRRRKVALIWVCLVSATLLFLLLVLLFYVVPVYDCEACLLFTCLPLTRDFCAEQNIDFKRDYHT